MIIYDLSLGLLHVSEHFWMFLVWISRKTRTPGHLDRARQIGVFDFGTGRVHPWAVLLRADYTPKYDNDQLMENEIHKWYCGDRASQNQFGYKIHLHFWKETLSGPPTPWHHLCSWLGRKLRHLPRISPVRYSTSLQLCTLISFCIVLCLDAQ